MLISGFLSILAKGCSLVLFLFDIVVACCRCHFKEFSLIQVYGSTKKKLCFSNFWCVQNWRAIWSWPLCQAVQTARHSYHSYRSPTLTAELKTLLMSLKYKFRTKENLNTFYKDLLFPPVLFTILNIFAFQKNQLIYICFT